MTLNRIYDRNKIVDVRNRLLEEDELLGWGLTNKAITGKEAIRASRRSDDIQIELEGIDCLLKKLDEEKGGKK